MFSQKLTKKEHLKSRKNIQMLFHSGEAFSVFPFRVIYRFDSATTTSGCKVGFSVPSRKFKKAVDRNRIKRQMRETYRLQKEQLAPFLTQQQIELHIFFIYTGHTLPKYDFLYRKMRKSLNKLAKRLLSKEHSNEKDK